MPYFNGVLERQPFIAGDRFSMADITLLASLMFAQPIGLPISDDLTALAAWRAKVMALPAVKNRSGQTSGPRIRDRGQAEAPASNRHRAAEGHFRSRRTDGSVYVAADGHGSSRQF